MGICLQCFDPSNAIIAKDLSHAKLRKDMGCRVVAERETRQSLNRECGLLSVSGFNGVQHGKVLALGVFEGTHARNR